MKFCVSSDFCNTTPLTNEAIANQAFDSLDALEEVTAQRCRALMKQPELIQGLTCYHWWPKAMA